MFHHASGGAAGTMQKQLDWVQFNKKHLDKFLGLAQKYFTKKEWKRLERGKDFWLDAEDMIERGICTGIVIDGIQYNNKEGIKKLKKYRKKHNNFLKG
jgi:ATP-dependent protease ClpP protease subunit